ncbi:alpha/beta hydrolase [Methylobacterium terricola]|uniref:Alpha/beta hydrolase n=1 Tax=Methylobacterium terricola TaxID=2583531 RepID=A0A5C4LPM3_9HYPH|nr:alpha/beta hydrolase [Methylobacterium terricola]
MSGFHVVRSGDAARRLAPVVLLHGSGGSEESLRRFGLGVAAGRPCILVRGRVPWEEGFAFFRRNPDRTLDSADLTARCVEFCGLLRRLAPAGDRPPLLVGYSNGAVMAAAAILAAPALSSGAVLLRPLSPRPAERFPALGGYPVLLLGGATDARRHPVDTPALAEQFRQAGARVTARVLPAGHGLDRTGADRRLTREWLGRRP